MPYDLDIFRLIYSAYFCSVCFSVHVLHFLYLTFDLDILGGYTQHISVVYVFLCMYCIFLI